MNRVIIAAALIFAVSYNCLAYNSNRLRWDTGLRIWNTELTGTLNVSGMSLDLDFDAKITDDNSPGMLVNYRIGSNSRVQFSYTHLAHRTDIFKGVTFNGKTYNAGSSLDMEVHLPEIRVYRDITEGTSTDFDISAGIKAAFTRIKIDGFSSALTSISEEEQYPVPIPEFGMHINLRITRNFYANSDLNFMYITLGDNKDMRLADFDMGLHYMLNAPRPGETKPYADWFSGADWYVEGGYRNLFMKGSVDDDDSVKLKYSGLYAGIHAKF